MTYSQRGAGATSGASISRVEVHTVVPDEDDDDIEEALEKQPQYDSDGNTISEGDFVSEE